MGRTAKIELPSRLNLAEPYPRQHVAKHPATPHLGVTPTSRRLAPPNRCRPAAAPSILYTGGGHGRMPARQGLNSRNVNYFNLF